MWNWVRKKVRIGAMRDVRERSLGLVRELGYEPASWLPLLDHCSVTRTVREIGDRLCVLHVVAAVAHGFDRKKSVDWLERESLWAGVTADESGFLRDGPRVDSARQAVVEAMWALAWASGLVADCDPAVGCAPDFVRLMPDLRVGESSARLRDGLRLRASAEVVEKLDVLYCLHNAVVNGLLAGRADSPAMPLYKVMERRRALEWLVAGESWDRVCVDT